MDRRSVASVHAFITRRCCVGVRKLLPLDVVPGTTGSGDPLGNDGSRPTYAIKQQAIKSLLGAKPVIGMCPTCKQNLRNTIDLTLENS